MTGYWRGTTRAGVLAGLLTGTATTILWKLVPAFVLSLAATWIVSRLTHRPDGVDTMFERLRPPA